MVAMVCGRTGVVLGVAGTSHLTLVRDTRKPVSEEHYEDQLNEFECEIDNLVSELQRRLRDRRSTKKSRKKNEVVYNLAIQMVKEDIHEFKRTHRVKRED